MNQPYVRHARKCSASHPSRLQSSGREDMVEQYFGQGSFRIQKTKSDNKVIGFYD
jgi:hypothetical protein